MSYPTLMVQLDMDRTHAELLHATANLAAWFNAGVIGIAASQPIEITADAYGLGAVIQQDRDDIERSMKESEREFRSALTGKVAWMEWRSLVTTQSLAAFVALEARSADLLITGQGIGPAPEANRMVDIGSVIMQAGRPVLIVPQGAENAPLDRVIVGWNDTSEARRAIADALPILKRAQHVSVAAIVPEAEMADGRAQVSGVVQWLGHHGIAAHAVVAPSSGNDTASLGGLADDDNADLIVAGAYGHSRIREWALGGVTRDLLLHGKRCAFLSH